MKLSKLYTTLCYSFLLITAACSDDEEPILKPQIPSSGESKLLSITHNGNANECFDWTFAYNQDWLVKAEGTNYTSMMPISYTSNISYHPNSISIKNSGDRAMKVTLNAVGLIEQMTVNTDEYQFHYQDGRLAGWNKKFNDENFGANKYNTKASINYDAQGNLSTIRYEMEENAPILIQLTASNELNDNGLLPETISKEFGLLGFEHLYYAGLFGRPTKNLVGKIKISGYKDNEKNTTVEFKYYRDDKSQNITLCNYSYMGKQASVVYTYEDSKK